MQRQYPAETACSCIEEEELDSQRSEVVRIQGATDTSSCIVEIVVESSDWRDLQLKLSRRSGGEDKSRW